MLKTKVTTLFLILTALFVGVLLTSNVVAVKLIQVGKIVFPAGTLVFPLSYIFGDVIGEVYGYKRARIVIWLGFLCNLLMVTVFSIAIALPPAPFWSLQEAYAAILGTTWRLMVASFCAYWVGSFSNAFVLCKMKVLTRGRFLWMRTIGSTMVGEGLDSLIFITVAFFGTVPLLPLFTMVFWQWLLKVLYEAIITPVTYWICSRIKQVEGIDTFDHDTNFNPFALE